VDSMHFFTPAKRGDILIFKGAINKVWRSSMEIGLKVVTQHLTTGEFTHILSAYFTFVAVDELGVPVEIAPILPETPLEKRRYQEAELRRQRRKKEKEQHLKRRATMKV
jgi:acyl-CoA hydrolase